MNLFHFIRPEWLLALIPLFILYWLLQRMQLQNKSWQSFCDKDLLPYLFEQTELKQKKRPLYLLLLAGLLAITALAGPSWEKRPQPVFKKQSALVIILDLSRSMDANDIKPSRLGRAILKVEDILTQRKEGQTALIVFAADAFTVTPLTEDTGTISSQLKSLSTEIMPLQGSNASKAIALAQQLFKQTSQPHGHVLLITDGVSEQTVAASSELIAPNYTLSVLGVGTAGGAPIPLADGGFFKDASGAIVVPKLNASRLQQLALAGSGSFRLLSADDSDLNQLLQPLKRGLSDALDGEQTEQTAFNTDSWVEAGPWLLLILLPVAAFAFRKGYLFVLLIFVLPHSDPGYAFDAGELWKNDNQKARELLNNNKASAAASLFTEKKWKAAAEYKSGQFDKALEAYQQLDTSDPEVLYNLANTQAQLGQFDKALENYNKVIAAKADHSDAKYNRDLVEKQKQQQQQQQDKNNQDSKNSQDNKDSKDDNNNDKKSQQNDASDGDKSDSEQQQSADNNKTDNADNNQEKDSAQDKNDNKDQDATDKSQDNSPQDNQAQQQQSAQDNTQSQEQQQANEQWLRRIPDDPGGLLRRKFRYQSEQRQNTTSGEQQW
ncbi:MAG: VWA domain-containing protein [Gammaproteobacteria bacterium]|nr:VWA domain-containing protein [Gammaproteobacteria bacterium]